MIAKYIFDDYFLEAQNIFPYADYPIEHVDPSVFLTAQRFDLPYKLYYIHCKVTGTNLEEAKKAYEEHIRCFSNGTFCEPGNKNKTSIEAFFSSFDSLIDSVRQHGFSDNYPVPVGTDGNIINGSHRTAIAIYFGLKLPIVRIQSKANYDYLFFKKKGMSEAFLDFGAYLFTFFSKDSYLAIVWPLAQSSSAFNNAISYLETTNALAYKKEISLTSFGVEQLVKIVYGKQEWTGTLENHFLNSTSKSRNCSYKRNRITTYLISNTNLETVVRLKDNFRSFLRLGKHSLHISDSRFENLLIGASLFNKNSIQLLNRYDVLSNKQFNDYLINEGWGTPESLENILFSPPAFGKTVYKWGEVAVIFGTKVLIDNFSKQKLSRIKLRRFSKKNKSKPHRHDLSKFISLHFRPLYMFLAKIRNLFFYKNWRSVNDIFLKFNNCGIDYVIISHWTYFKEPVDLYKNDIDILFRANKDLRLFEQISKYCKKKGNSYLVLVNGNFVSFDAYTTDNCFYGKKWSLDLIKEKRFLQSNSNLFRLSEEHFLYTLLYNVLVHKKRELTFLDYKKLESVKCSQKIYDSPKQHLDLFLNKWLYSYASN